MNKFKRKTQAFAVIIAIFSMFAFPNMASAGIRQFDSVAYSNGSYLMHGMKFLGYLFGVPVSTTYHSWNFNIASLADESPLSAQCDFDESYAYLANPGNRASFKFYWTGAAWERPSEMDLYMLVAPSYDLDFNSGNSVFIRFNDYWGNPHEYQLGLTNDDVDWHYLDGVTGRVTHYLPYLNHSNINNYDDRTYHFIHFKLTDLDELGVDIMKSTVEGGFIEGNDFGSDDDSRVTCVQLKSKFIY